MVNVVFQLTYNLLEDVFEILKGCSQTPQTPWGVNLSVFVAKRHQVWAEQPKLEESPWMSMGIDCLDCLDA